MEELVGGGGLEINVGGWKPGYERVDDLPGGTLESLAEHAGGRRGYVYTEAQFLAAETHDALWNACQQEMRLRGKIHGYYRMYWGKKIIEWSATLADSLWTMIKCHELFALYGRASNHKTCSLYSFDPAYEL